MSAMCVKSEGAGESAAPFGFAGAVGAELFDLP